MASSTRSSKRAAASLGPATPVGGRDLGYDAERRQSRYDERDRYDDDRRDHDRHRKKRNRRSFLEDLFELE